MTLAPIAIFTYARLSHTRRTVDALLQNPGVAKHDLIVFSDAARTEDKLSAVEDVRSYLKTLSGFRSVTIRYHTINNGLAKSIIDGVTEVLTHYDRVIVLEDDMVTSPYFLAYMNQALELYADDDRVISIHGYVYPVKCLLPETFFLPGADCWGWATWRRGWALFNPNGKALLRELKDRRLLNEFDFNDSYPYSKMLESQIKGLNDSWAIRWYASAFLAGKLTLYPGKSLVHNIGNDGSGTHCDANDKYDTKLSPLPIDLDIADVKSSIEAREAIASFFKGNRSSLVHRILRRFRNAI